MEKTNMEKTNMEKTNMEKTTMEKTNMNIKRITKSNNTKKKHFNYVDRNDKQITNGAVLDRINKLVIPPAYKEVKISDVSNNYLQATGIDDKGRKQYIYRPSFIEKRAKGKYCQLKHFGQMIEQIRKDIRQNMLSDKPIQDKTKMISLILYILDTCHFRIGNINYYNQYKTHGVSTLLISHLKFGPRELDIEFIGKKGVINKCSIKDPLTIKLMKELVKIAKKCKSQFVFNYNDDGKIRLIRPDEVNTFLSKYHPDIILKMYRTWAANHVFLEEMIKRQKDFKALDKSLINKDDHKHPAKEEKRVERTRNKLIREILIEIANKLHNTPTVSKKSYLDNNLIEIYMNDPVYFWRKISRTNKNNLTNILIDFLSKNCIVGKGNKNEMTHKKNQKQNGGWMSYVNRYLFN
jgi:DNA topoisomerase-1